MRPKATEVGRYALHFGEVGYVRQSVNLILTRYDGSEMQSIN